MKTDFARIKQNKVLIVGDLLLDKYWIGDTNRISPEAPVPVVLVKDAVEKLGGAGNVAANVSSLGGSSCLVSEVGDDADGDALLTLCDNNAIKSEILRNSSMKTIVKHRIVSQGQQLLRADFESETRATDNQGIFQAFSNEVKVCDVVVISDYGKGSVSNATELIALSRQLGKKVLVDPKGNDFSKYVGADLITPNLKEFEAIAGHCETQEILISSARKILLEFNFGALLVTQGSHGMTLVTEVDEYYFDAESQEVFDVTGAGDTVCATIATFWTTEFSLSQACEIANIAAGIAVRKFGVITVGLEELRAALDSQKIRPTVSIASSKSDVLSSVESARSKGSKVIMTNGCFDILHAGHVQYLNEARALGDFLLVAINDDASVSLLKGASRPINHLSSRIQLVEALRCVDCVVSFSEGTPERLISEVRPDVLVKGGDYELHEIAGADAVLSYGGEVRILGLVEGYSTTSIADKLALGLRENSE